MEVGFLVVEFGDIEFYIMEIYYNNLEFKSGQKNYRLFNKFIFIIEFQFLILKYVFYYVFFFYCYVQVWWIILVFDLW